MNLRYGLRNAVQVFILPVLIALLPWWLGFRLARWLCRWDRLYRAEVLETLDGLRAAGRMDLVNPTFLRNLRLLRLVDHTDLYLSRIRGDRWVRRHVEVEGAWPAHGPVLALTLHWGNGMLALRHAGMHGVHAQGLVAKFDRSSFPDNPLMYEYIRLRTDECGRALRHPAVMDGAGVRGLLKAVQAGRPIMGLIDVPVSDPNNASDVTLLGQRARFADGMLRIAERCQLPVVAFWSGFDPETGRRWLHIEPARHYASAGEACAAMGAHLDALLRTRPWGWHLWSEWRRYLADPSGN